MNSVVWKDGALFICHNDGNSVVVRNGCGWEIKEKLSEDGIKALKSYMKKRRPEGCVGCVEVLT